VAISSGIQRLIALLVSSAAERVHLEKPGVVLQQWRDDGALIGSRRDDDIGGRNRTGRRFSKEPDAPSPCRNRMTVTPQRMGART